MSRFSRYDTDEERLPAGMTRVGYDADTQVYTFSDIDGSLWVSAPGNQYGRLTRVSGPTSADDASDSEPFLESQTPMRKTSWRHDMMPLLNFGVLVGLSLLVLFWFIGRRAPEEALEVVVKCPGRSVTAAAGDSCWDLAQAEGISVDEIVAMNSGLDCAKLAVGYEVCLSV
ncbi:hypothetical protein V8C34DRAFT_40517 [Trichoderma compactum]